MSYKHQFEAYWHWLTWIRETGNLYKDIPTLGELRAKGETINGLVQQYWKQWGI